MGIISEEKFGPKTNPEIGYEFPGELEQSILNIIKAYSADGEGVVTDIEDLDRIDITEGSMSMQSRENLAELENIFSDAMKTAEAQFDDGEASSEKLKEMIERLENLKNLENLPREYWNRVLALVEKFETTKGKAV